MLPQRIKNVHGRFGIQLYGYVYYTTMTTPTASKLREIPQFCKPCQNFRHPLCEITKKEHPLGCSSLSIPLYQSSRFRRNVSTMPVQLLSAIAA